MVVRVKDSDATITELVRLGLRGDSESVRRFTRALVRARVRDLGPDDDLSKKLSKQLVDHSVQSPELRKRAIGREVVSELSTFLRPVDTRDVEAPLLAQATSAVIQQIVDERTNADVLAEHGMEPTRAVLFVGPPGVGKTMAAENTADRLGLPLVAVDLGTVMSSHLGRSGQNLTEALSYAERTPCVFLIDEFDALAKKRDDPSDVGELKRLVNLLLLKLEKWPTTGLLLAATNHPELLDRAIWRRFDRVVEFALPDTDLREQIVSRELNRYAISSEAACLQRIAASTVGYSGSDLVRTTRNVVRKALMEGKGNPAVLLEKEVVDDLVSRCSSNSNLREEFCLIASRKLAWTQRDIAGVLGVSHVAVGKIIRRGLKGQSIDIR